MEKHQINIQLENCRQYLQWRRCFYGLLHFSSSSFFFFFFLMFFCRYQMVESEGKIFSKVPRVRFTPWPLWHMVACSPRELNWFPHFSSLRVLTSLYSTRADGPTTAQMRVATRPVDSYCGHSLHQQTLSAGRRAVRGSLRFSKALPARTMLSPSVITGLQP